MTSSIVSWIEAHVLLSEEGIDWNAVLAMWIDKLSSVGVAMEFDATDARWLRREDAREIMQRLQEQQYYIFQQFDSLNKGCSVKDLQDAISRGILDAKACDRGGLYLVHIAAAYDRVYVLEIDQGEECYELDSTTRSVDSKTVGLTASEKVDHMHPTRIMFDPMGNVPMKVYQFGGIDEIGQVVEDSWTPRLKLTDEERDIVETKGTVLQFGRSGTGKKVCILSRMEYDRQVNIHDSTFTQLFVARSR
ncbi:MAG: hypothetical protein SGBAC_003624 [Bacillariaceae sp.]